jgi:cell fate regulator YaaT (PSP1 superfamily)
MEYLFDVKLDSGAKYRARGEESLTLKEGDWCVIRKDFYLDYGQVEKVFTEQPSDSEKSEIPKIQRKATVVDQGKAHENLMRGKSALRTAGQFVERLNLPMKLINAHYSFDGKLITVQFSAEGRVDFRELVKQLSHTMNTRIELRQIGVRDETAIMGGIAVCGRALCCCAFLKEFASINVKMAKEQDLSLTPSTISGLCGRLKCCLKYEHAGYLEMDKSMPRRGDCCECKEGRGRVVDRNLLSQKVVVQLEETGRSVTCLKDEINVVYPEKYKVKQESRGRSPSATDTLDKLPHDIKKLED